MQHVVEIAHLVRGEPVSVRRLSAARERVSVLLTILGVVALHATGAAGTVLIARALGHGLFAPAFISIWLAAMLMIGTWAGRRAYSRARRYRLGADLGADAFASAGVDLVRRVGSAFELTAVPGMSGHIAGGRAPMPIEAMVADRPRTMTLEPGATAHLALGDDAFSVRSLVDRGRAPVSVRAAREMVRPLSGRELVVFAAALVGSLFCMVSAGTTIADPVLKRAVARGTTPWEAEKTLRLEAQAQARSLHTCFDPLPASCQRPGYVGIGLSLTRDGEIRSHWIARSTYGNDCPVEACMQEVISTWVFDPLPEPMRLVLPVQVLRTGKPIPPSVASTSGESSGECSDRANFTGL